MVPPPAFVEDPEIVERKKRRREEREREARRAQDEALEESHAARLQRAGALAAAAAQGAHASSAIHSGPRAPAGAHSQAPPSGPGSSPARPPPHAATAYGLGARVPSRWDDSLMTLPVAPPPRAPADDSRHAALPPTPPALLGGAPTHTGGGARHHASADPYLLRAWPPHLRRRAYPHRMPAPRARARGDFILLLLTSPPCRPGKSPSVEVGHCAAPRAQRAPSSEVGDCAAPQEEMVGSGAQSAAFEARGGPDCAAPQEVVSTTEMAAPEARGGLECAAPQGQASGAEKASGAEDSSGAEKATLEEARCGEKATVAGGKPGPEARTRADGSLAAGLPPAPPGNGASRALELALWLAESVPPQAAQGGAMPVIAFAVLPPGVVAAATAAPGELQAAGAQAGTGPLVAEDAASLAVRAHTNAAARCWQRSAAFLSAVGRGGSGMWEGVPLFLVAGLSHREAAGVLADAAADTPRVLRAPSDAELPGGCTSAAPLASSDNEPPQLVSRAHAIIVEESPASSDCALLDELVSRAPPHCPLWSVSSYAAVPPRVLRIALAEHVQPALGHAAEECADASKAASQSPTPLCLWRILDRQGGAPEAAPASCVCTVQSPAASFANFLSAFSKRRHEFMQQCEAGDLFVLARTACMCAPDALPGSEGPPPAAQSTARHPLAQLVVSLPARARGLFCLLPAPVEGKLHEPCSRCMNSAQAPQLGLSSAQATAPAVKTEQMAPASAADMMLEYARFRLFSGYAMARKVEVEARKLAGTAGAPDPDAGDWLARASLPLDEIAEATALVEAGGGALPRAAEGPCADADTLLRLAPPLLLQALMGYSDEERCGKQVGQKLAEAAGQQQQQAQVLTPGGTVAWWQRTLASHPPATTDAPHAVALLGLLGAHILFAGASLPHHAVARILADALLTWVQPGWLRVAGCTSQQEALWLAVCAGKCCLQHAPSQPLR